MTAVEDVVQNGSAGRARGPLRVMHVITTLGPGGAERQLGSVVVQRHHPTKVVALYSAGTVGDDLIARGHEISVLGMSGPRKLTAVFRLAREIRRYRPEVVHVHLLAAQLWGITAARLAGVRVVISTEHSLMDDSIENRPLTPWLRTIYLVLARMATHVVAVSETTRGRLTRWGVRADRISVIENGMDFEALRYSVDDRVHLRRELGMPDETVVVGAVGRLEPVKRFPQLIDAVAPSLRAGVRELVVVGDGPLRGELIARARELGVDAAVHVTGPRSDVPALLSAMDVLVSPSRDETFGMAVVEALASGLPVVYAQCPALDELDEAPPGAIPLGADDCTPDREQVGIVRGLERALSASADNANEERGPVPVELAERYGIERTVRELENLYHRMVMR